MQSCIIILGIILTSQVSDPSNRYSPVTPPAATNSTQASPPTSTLGRPPAVLQGQLQEPLSGSTSRSITPSENPLRSSPPSQPTTQATSPPALSSPPTRNLATTPPRPPATRLTKVIKPATLLSNLVLSNLVEPSTNNKLPGTLLTLADAVQGARSRTEQSQRVALYWKLSRATSDYRLAQLEETQLRAQQSGLLQPSTGWSAALQAAMARKQLASSAVHVAQLRMQNALGRNESEALPLPSVLPHCGAYQTKYEQIFQGRGPSEARHLAKLLPQRHQQLNSASAEVTAAQQWLRLISQQRSAQSDDRLLLRAYQQLALQRREFVAAAYHYNQDITRYTDLAVPQEVATGRLVAMLIQTSTGSNDFQSGSIRRASAQEPPGTAAVVDRYKPRTFATDETSKALKSSVPEGDERSILVEPGRDVR